MGCPNCFSESIDELTINRQRELMEEIKGRDSEEIVHDSLRKAVDLEENQEQKLEKEEIAEIINYNYECVDCGALLKRVL